MMVRFWYFTNSEKCIILFWSVGLKKSGNPAVKRQSESTRKPKTH
jgi:hypothetical protein